VSPPAESDEPAHTGVRARESDEATQPRRCVRDRLSWMFPAAPAAPLTVGRVALAAAAVLVGAGISLGRIGGPGPFNSIFAEDASNFLNDAINHGPLRAIFTPFNGYYHIGPRLLAEVASHAPLAWAPAVLSVEAALVTSLVAVGVYIASAGHLRSTAARLLVAVPVVAMPVAENVAATATNNVATLQFFAIYAAFWMLLWVPATRLGKTVAVLTVALTAFSTVLTALLLPLALVRLYVRRRHADVATVAVIAAGTAMHLIALALGLTSRPPFLQPRLAPAWALDGYVRWALPHQLFGFRWTGLPLEAGSYQQFRLVEAAWFIVVAVLVGALLQRRAPGQGSAWTPLWGLAGIAAVYSMGLLLFQLMSSGRPEERYNIAPGLLLVVALAALLKPSGTIRGSAAFALYAVLVVVVMAVNYRDDTARSQGPAWDNTLRRGAAECAQNPTLTAVALTASGNGVVRVACEKLR
jgi:hypothetical protein